MRIFRLASLLFFSLWVLSILAVSQEGAAPAPQTSAPEAAPAAQPAPEAPVAAPPASFDAVLDRMVQREHLFLAQIRHMRPLVETYLQDLKVDNLGIATPLKDQYFLGRLAMGNGPEDTSFMGQPGFSHRMLSRLTNL
jgi:hypothetical protein